MAGTVTATITLALSAGTVANAGAHANRPLIIDAATGARVLGAAEFSDAFRVRHRLRHLQPERGHDHLDGRQTVTPPTRSLTP